MAWSSRSTVPSLLLVALLLCCSGVSRAVRSLEEAPPKEEEEHPHPAVPELPEPELPPHPTDVVPPEPPRPAVPEVPKPELPPHPAVPELPKPELPAVPNHELSPLLKAELPVPPKPEGHYLEPEAKP